MSIESIHKLGVQVAARTPGRIETTLWRSQRMDSLSDKPSGPQIRCLPLRGRSDVFQYEVNVQGRWIASNYQFACWVVANQQWIKRNQEARV